MCICLSVRWMQSMGRCSWGSETVYRFLWLFCYSSLLATRILKFVRLCFGSKFTDGHNKVSLHTWSRNDNQWLKLYMPEDERITSVWNFKRMKTKGQPVSETLHTWRRKANRCLKVYTPEDEGIPVSKNLNAWKRKDNQCLKVYTPEDERKTSVWNFTRLKTKGQPVSETLHARRRKDSQYLKL
jgi:hypothetical protein